MASCISEQRKPAPSTQVAAPRRVPLYTFYIANTISLVGDRITLIAIPWFVLQTTGSIQQTALTAFCTMLPTALSAFFGGGLVDRLGYKRTSVVADCASCLCTLLIPLLHMTIGLAFWQLLTLAFIGGLLKSPGETARTSMLPELVEGAQVRIERATSLSDGVSRLSGLLGAPIAAVIMVSIGAGNLLWFDAASFALSALLIGLLVPKAASNEKKGSSGIRQYLSDLHEGLNFIYRDKVILALTVTILITNLLDGAMGAVITPAYVQHFFHSPVPQGILMGVFGGMAFLGTLIYGAIGHRLPRRPTLGVSFTIVSMRIIGMALLPALPFLIFIHALTGLACGPLNPLLSAMSYGRVPKELRARVFGTSTAGVLVGIPAGVMLCGYLVTWIGLIPSVFTMGAIYLLTTLSLLINPALKGMEKAPQEQSKSPSQANPAT